MKQHILPKQLKEITFEQAKLILGDDLNSRKGYLLKWYLYHHKKVTIGKMIEYLGDDFDSIDCYHKASEKPWIVMLYKEKDYIEFRDKNICDALWQATKAKLEAEYGNRKGKVIPKIEWIEEIKEYCFINDIPYFEKNSLQGIVNRPLIQQMPEGLK